MAPDASTGIVSLSVEVAWPAHRAGDRGFRGELPPGSQHHPQREPERKRPTQWRGSCRRLGGSTCTVV